MAIEIRYRGRTFFESDILFIRQLIAAHPGVSRFGLSKKLCAAWNWVQANGTPRDMVCRGLMLWLHRAGHIELPAPRRSIPNPLARWGRRGAALPPAGLALWEQLGLPPEASEPPLVAGLCELLPLELSQVRRTPDEKLFGLLMEAHHYLGYTQPVGEHLKFLVRARGRPVACVAFSSAPRHLEPRDRYIGWPAEVRRRNIRLIAYNVRFLILPWVKVPHLASHLLGRMARELSGHWERVYRHPIHYLETFVDPERFRGTCYRAANWVCVGRTTGRGKDDIAHRGPNRTVKEVWGYGLSRDFRERLCAP